ncbi:MAG: hypothetical protein U0636_10805 [Phycisphaerales bacterium]
MVQFLATDGTKLFRADSTGAVFQGAVLSAAIQSLTVVPAGYNIAGLAAGDILACAATATAGQYAIYRLNDPFGAATLTQIGSTSVGIGSMVLANGNIYGVEDSLNPVRVYQLDSSNWSISQTWNTGISAGGSGGLAWDDVNNRFLISDATNNRLMSWGPGGTGTPVGPVGFSFTNNGMEFFNGTLYGALRPESAGNTLRLGSYDLTTGAFTTMATVTGVTGSGTGFVALPAPGTLAVAVLGLVGSRRRRL